MRNLSNSVASILPLVRKFDPTKSVLYGVDSVHRFALNMVNTSIFAVIDDAVSTE
jgi:hypothetical protein